MNERDSLSARINAAHDGGLHNVDGWQQSARHEGDPPLNSIEKLRAYIEGVRDSILPDAAERRFEQSMQEIAQHDRQQIERVRGLTR